MNKLTTSIFATIIILTVVFFLGRLFMLSGLQREIAQAQSRLEQMEDSQKELEVELNKLRGKAKEEIKPERSNFLLKPGQEHSLLSSIVNCSGNMKISDFNLMPPYFVKSAQDFSSGAESQGFKAGDQPAKLDDQGNPIGMSFEDESEWPGIEIIPLKFSFATTYRNLGNFFSEIDRTMPINQIRSADVLLSDSGITRGTAVILFPVAEK